MKKNILTVATANDGKLKEIREICAAAHLPFEIRSLKDVFDPVPDIPETGETFSSNAFIKADWVFARVGGWVLADDSGLEVDILNGAPGVYSARYSGEPKNDTRNLEKLLADIANVPLEKRTARFRCVLALVGPNDFDHEVNGTCEGIIATSPSGSNGFGYDPVFIPAGWSKTFAEGESEEKHEISHRGKALAQLVGVLRDAVKS